MPYDFKITAKKAFFAFIAAGITGLLAYLTSLTGPEATIFVVVAIPLLRVVEDYLRHKDEGQEPAIPVPV